ncbi:calcium channel flower isoform X1 [Halyomorpha halys]|uniref:calcium channel flower isoform X1 n=1 Tax=Halyomorpha halys TaxID=286706 RepID=UPI0006D4D0BA|nr:calcium channel flower isoform X1 [Halyomorpha halys]
MSFMEKVGTIWKRPGEDVVPKDEVPLWLKYGARALGTCGGGIAIFLGLWNCFSILLGGVECLLSGMWQMIAGFVVIVIEAPCCCFFIDFVHTFSDWADKRPFWHRAVFYVSIGFPPIVMCIGISSFFGGGLIIGCGVLYGIMALGKKAPLEEMRVQAAQQQLGNSNKSNLNLVENATSISISPPPV